MNIVRFTTILVLTLLFGVTQAEESDPFWESVWSNQNPNREIPAENYKDILNFKEEFSQNGYTDCVILIKTFAADNVITESEMKQTIECQGKYKAEEEKVEILRLLKQ